MARVKSTAGAEAIVTPDGGNFARGIFNIHFRFDVGSRLFESGDIARHSGANSRQLTGNCVSTWNLRHLGFFRMTDAKLNTQSIFQGSLCSDQQTVAPRFRQQFFSAQNFAPDTRLVVESVGEFATYFDAPLRQTGTWVIKIFVGAPGVKIRIQRAVGMAQLHTLGSSLFFAL